jgi:hypothetical protein
MQNRLAMCATYLREVEEKLMALQDSLEVSVEQRAKVAEALSFLEQARHAVSETNTRIESLQAFPKEQSS